MSIPLLLWRYANLERGVVDDTPSGPTTVTIQPDATDGLDTLISAVSGQQDNNYGVTIKILAGASGNLSSPYRGLLKIANLGIPVGSTIQSAVLSLYLADEPSTTDYNVSLHRSLVEWYEGVRNAAIPVGENASTWNRRNHGADISWGSPGGQSGVDYVATPTDTVLITGPGQWFEWDVQADVQAWVNGTADNYGWFLIGIETDTNKNKNFYSSDYTDDPTKRPKLEIIYV